jgi:hypothetical protein
MVTHQKQFTGDSSSITVKLILKKYFKQLVYALYIYICRLTFKGKKTSIFHVFQGTFGVLRGISKGLCIYFIGP